MLYLAGVNVTAETKPVKQYQVLTKRTWNDQKLLHNCLLIWPVETVYLSTEY